MKRLVELAPLAIAMWDTGWLTRHYQYGSFADWDKALDEKAIKDARKGHGEKFANPARSSKRTGTHSDLFR